MALFSLRSTPSLPDAAIRRVRPEDADRIRRILQVAFADENRRMGLQRSRLPTMSDRLLEFYVDRGAEASFVAEGRGGLIGFCLACRWGSTAWMGPIAVLPPAQGRGLGRRLVEASAGLLRRLGVRTLGLETMPRSYRNLQFYTDLDMRLDGMTLDLSRHLAAGSPPTPTGPLLLATLSTLEPSAREESLGHITRLCGGVCEGLDYAGEARRTLEHEVGEVFLVLFKAAPIGFVIAHDIPYALEEAPGTVRVNTVVLQAPEGGGGPPPFGLLMDALEVWMTGLGHDAVIVRVPARQEAALRTLHRRDYRITHSDVRMSYSDLRERPPTGCLHLDRWE